MLKIRQARGLLLLSMALFLSYLGYEIFGKKDLASDTVAPSIEEQPEVVDLTEAEETPQVVLRDFHRQEVRNGKKLWEVRASEAEFDSESGLTYTEDAQLELYREDGKVSLKAGRAKLHMKNGGVVKAELENKVEIVLEDNTSLKADFGTWSVESGVVEIPGRVYIKGEGFDLSGSGLELEVDKKHFRLAKKVKSKYSSQPKIAFAKRGK